MQQRVPWNRAASPEPTQPSESNGAQRVPWPGEAEEPQAEGFGARALNTARRGASQAIDAVTGRQNPLSDAGEVRDEMPPGRGPIERNLRSLRIGAGMFLNRNDSARAEIIANTVPTSEFVTDHALAQSRGLEVPQSEPRMMVRMAPDREWVFIDDPGLSAQDVNDFGADVVKFLPAARLGAGAQGVVKGMALGGAGAGATELISQGASGALGSESGINTMDVAFAAGAGVFAEPLTRLGGRLLSRGQGARSSVSDVLTDQSARVLNQADDLVNVSPVMQAGSRQADDAVPAPQARQELANEFDVRLTRGQALREPEAIRQESQIVRGTEGPAARQIVRDRLEEQAGELHTAANRLAGSQATGRANLDDAGAAIRETTRANERAAMGAVNDAYELARSHNASLAAEHFPLVARAARMRISQEVPLESGGIRATHEALGELDRMVGRATQSGSLDLRMVERYRSRIGTLTRTAENPADARTARMVRETLDDWLDRAVDRALIDGDAEAIEAFRSARGMRVRYARAYSENRSSRTPSGRRISDRAGSLIEQISHDDLTGTQVMNLLYGRRELGVRGGAEAMRRLVSEVGEGTAQHQALREGFVARLMERMPQVSQSVGVPKTVADRWVDAVEGSGREMTEVLFNEQERFALRRFARLLQEMAPPDGAAATSGTPEGTIALMNRMFERMSGSIGMSARTAAQLRSGFDPRVARAQQAVEGLTGRSGHAVPSVLSASGARAFEPREPDHLPRRRNQSPN